MKKKIMLIKLVIKNLENNSIKFNRLIVLK